MQMATIGPDEELTSVERQGMAWLALISSGRATAQDLAKLEEWRCQDPANAGAFAKAVRLHKLLGSPEFAETPHYVAPLWERPLARRALLAGLGVTGASYLALLPPLELWPSFQDLAADYRTGTGERKQVALADGLSLELNTRTSISHRSSPNGPGIELLTGELAASVRMPPGQVFRSYTGKAQIETNNAVLNLRRTNDGSCVTCVTGEARVFTASASVQMASKQQVVITNSSISPPASVDPAVITAWGRGLLIFHDATVSSIVAEVNRYRPGKIIVLTAALANRQLNASLRVDHIDGVVAYLQRTAGASVTTLPGNVVLLS